MRESRQRCWGQVCAAVVLLFLGLLVGCADATQPSATSVLTQKKIAAGRIPVTVLVKYAFSINGFETAVEAKFPEIDLIQVSNYTRNMGIAEYANRMEHGDLTDIVMTWPLNVGKEYWEDRLLDLAGFGFTNRYNLNMLNSISQEGKLYYLPGPAQVRGIVYNKTLFAEKGWQVPTDFESFIQLCKDIEASGMRSLQLGMKNAEVLDTAFVGFSYGGCYSKPKDVQFLENYNAGKGSFASQYGPALDVFQRMADEGIWKKTDLDIHYAQREQMLFNRQCAMIEDSVLMARMGEISSGTTDEFALMPFFNPGTDSDWARLYMVCYIGVNKELIAPQNKEKRDLVMTLMDYISTPEGQAALAADTGAMFSSLKGVGAPEIEEIAALAPALNSGRYAIFPTLKNAQAALREGLQGILLGELDKAVVIELVDAANRKPVEQKPPEVLGTAKERFTQLETGNFVTDALRAWSECDVALFLDNGKDGKDSGKGIGASLYEGDVTTLDLQTILPDLKYEETATLWKVRMTGADLLRTLEYAIPVANNQTGWFYYFSGLKMTYDPTAEPGSRILEIKTINGKEIDPAATYTIAAMDETLPSEYFIDCEKTDVKIEKILQEAIRQQGTIAPAKDGRFTLPS